MNIRILQNLLKALCIYHAWYLMTKANEARVTFARSQGRPPRSPQIIGELNATVRGWVGYFHYRNCSNALAHVRGHVEERLRTHLQKRHKIKQRETGYALFKNRILYERYGLYKVSTSAGWTKVHAS